MNTVTDKTHARLGPSGWDWWSRCPGAPVLTAGLPRTTSKYAAEGTAAHEVADLCLKQLLDCGIVETHMYLGETFHVEGYDIVVDLEMVEAVYDYINTVREFVGSNGTLLPEQQVPIGHLTGEPGAEGTSDCIGITADGKRLIVIDLKYGKGVAVDAKDNGQGRIYALGALHKFGMIYDEIEEVEIVIIQPRLDSVSSEILTVAALKAFGEEVEVAAAAVALEDAVWAEAPGDPTRLTLTPGEKQCRFCSAKGVCPALRSEVSDSLAVVASTAADFADLTLPKQAAAVAINPEIDVERLAEFMRAVPLIEAAISGVRAEVERRLFDGQTVPGYYLGVGKAGNRVWKDEEAAARMLVRNVKKANAYEMKLLSPAKAEKLIKKVDPKVWDLIERKHITQPEGKPSVCKEGDKNPRYALPSSDDFTDLVTVEVLEGPTEGLAALIPNTEENLAARFRLAAEQSEADALLG